MGLMDKVKAQASTLAQQTKDATSAGMAKLDQSQASRKADGMLRSLGLAILAERTGRATAETAAQITQLLSDLSAHETQFGINLVQQAAQAQAQQLANQMRPGDFLTSSASPVDPSVSATMPGAAPAYGGAPGLWWRAGLRCWPADIVPAVRRGDRVPRCGSVDILPWVGPGRRPGRWPAGRVPRRGSADVVPAVRRGDRVPRCGSVDVLPWVGPGRRPGRWPAGRVPGPGADRVPSGAADRVPAGCSGNRLP